MTGRHEAPVRASDSWLIDQLEAWRTEMDAYTADAMDELQYRAGSITLEQFSERQHQRMLRATVLLCTARQLVTEVLARG